MINLLLSLIILFLLGYLLRYYWDKTIESWKELIVAKRELDKIKKEMKDFIN